MELKRSNIENYNDIAMNKFMAKLFQLEDTCLERMVTSSDKDGAEGYRQQLLLFREIYDIIPHLRRAEQDG